MTNMTGPSADGDLWIRRFHPSPAAPVRLVCLPHAGGAASHYFPMSRDLSPGVEVLAVQYPGRQDRRHEPAVTDLHVLADAVASVLRPFTDRPLALFGHSMGAVVAYEVALRMEAAGAGPRVLFVSGRRAPSVARHEDVHTRPDDELVAELRALAGTDGDLLGDPEVLRMVLPAVRADYRAVETYRPAGDAVLRCPVRAFAGREDPRVAVADVLAWKAHTDGGFDLEVLPGGHFFPASSQRKINDTVNHLCRADNTGR